VLAASRKLAVEDPSRREGVSMSEHESAAEVKGGS
jgi:hypothetical protein